MMGFRRMTALFLTVLLAFTMILPVSAASAEDALSDTAKWLQKNVTDPVVASIGGEYSSSAKTAESSFYYRSENTAAE